jgi:hypothetical protein
MTFIRDANGSAEASSNGHDDRIMSGMIGLFVMHQVINEEPIDSPDFQTMKSPISDSSSLLRENNMRVAADVDFEYILAYGHQDSYEQSWLNY